MALHFEGHTWNVPHQKFIYRALSRTFDINKHLYWPISEFADDIEFELNQNNVPYDTPFNADSWYDSFKVRAHRATTVDDVMSLFSLRQESYPYKCYHFYVIFEAHPQLDDKIGVEFLITKPTPNFFPSDPEETDETDSGPEPEIED